MQYSFTCPLDECGHKITVDSSSREEAVAKITNMAKGHLAGTHPDVHKTDEQVYNDINSMTIEETESPDDEG